MFRHSHAARFFTMTRSRWMRHFLQAGVLVAALFVLRMGTDAGTKLRNPLLSADSTGTLETYSTAGGVDLSNPFFQKLGTNERTCGSCHVSRDSWSITPA